MLELGFEKEGSTGIFFVKYILVVFYKIYIEYSTLLKMKGQKTPKWPQKVKGKFQSTENFHFVMTRIT